MNLNNWPYLSGFFSTSLFT